MLAYWNQAHEFCPCDSLSATLCSSSNCLWQGSMELLTGIQIGKEHHECDDSSQNIYQRITPRE